MAILKITRSDEYTNRIRPIKIFLDGILIGKIGNAETKEFELMHGTHLLQAKIDWCSSNKLTFTVAENGVTNFYLDSFAKHSSLGTLATIYYISFGANKFLNLKEV
jgi:hypothetical protein